MTIGERLRESRIKAKLTQEEVASRLGLGKQAVHKYEAGIITNVPSDNIEIMAEMYGVTPSYLMGWNENPIPQAIETKVPVHKSGIELVFRSAHDLSLEDQAEIEETLRFMIEMRRKASKKK